MKAASRSDEIIDVVTNDVCKRPAQDGHSSAPGNFIYVQAIHPSTVSRLYLKRVHHPVIQRLEGYWSINDNRAEH